MLKFDEKLSLFLKYLFIETIRNTYEHAEVEELYLSAQKWKSKSLLEIAISDTGCGVSNSLRKYKPYSDKSDDAWRNSGYGLYLMRKLATEYGGSFLICSGSNALREDRNGIRVFETKYEGTTIAIRIRTDLNYNFEEIRRKIVLEGERQSSSEQTSIHSASKSSGGRYN